MSRNSKDPVKSRHIKYLLYEDNPQHVAALDRIKEDNHAYIGIRHAIFDLDGNEITEDAGKPHFHVYQAFDSPVYPAACARRYGLLDDSGKPSVQFCRTISGNFNNALVYLTHLNAPDKELYSDQDLFGWSLLLRQYQTAALAYSDKHIDVRTALYAMNDWISSDMAGKIIQSSDIIRWLITTPYLRFRNERLFLSAIAEHNKQIWTREARQRIEDFGRGQIELNRRVSGLTSDTFGIEDLPYD